MRGVYGLECDLFGVYYACSTFVVVVLFWFAVVEVCCILFTGGRWILIVLDTWLTCWFLLVVDCWFWVNCWFEVRGLGCCLNWFRLAGVCRFDGFALGWGVLTVLLIASGWLVDCWF